MPAFAHTSVPNWHAFGPALPNLIPSLSRIPFGMKIWPPKKGQRLIASGLVFHGAGDGNRTRVISLEGRSSTIEPHPRFAALAIVPQVALSRRNFSQRSDLTTRRTAFPRRTPARQPSPRSELGIRAARPYSWAMRMIFRIRSASSSQQGKSSPRSAFFAIIASGATAFSTHVTP